MAAISEEYIRSILQEVTCIQDVQNWQFTKEKFENIAQNYFGIIVPVVLSGEQNRQEVKLELVLKLAPTDEQYRVSGAVTLMFAREIFAYNVMLKAYQEAQEHFLSHIKFIIPKCYYIQTKYCREAIVMQNMLAIGYEPLTDKMFLDLDHILISLQALAKLHALSFIVEHSKPDLFRVMSDNCVPLTEKSGKRYMEVMRDRLEKAINLFDGTQYISLLQKLKYNCSSIFESVITSVKKTCICHGDIWKENILYKYQDDKPVSACLIDYQSARISCAAFDILYLIVSSTNTQLRKEHYPQLLDTYYQTFAETLKEKSLKSEEVYSRQMLDYDLKIVAPACVITANCALWLSNGLQEEGHIRSKKVLATQAEKDSAINKYKGIVKAMIDDCCRFGYMNLDCE